MAKASKKRFIKIVSKYTKKLEDICAKVNSRQKFYDYSGPRPIARMRAPDVEEFGDMLRLELDNFLDDIEAAMPYDSEHSGAFRQ